ncbi:uncharacterized protein LOC135105232 isoform X2 [Scylla paramamosain]|uniref:uncharacterized protein LOC135105232 isoform X2 n=1 Tax=Scylla paramamosain TaxID=85552 RepID=UPI0030835FF6
MGMRKLIFVEKGSRKDRATPEALQGNTIPRKVEKADSEGISFVGADLERCKQAHHQPTQMENAQRNLQELQSNLLIELEILVGSRRAEKLYRNHVCRKHFLMVYGEGEKEKRLVDKLKRCLRNEGEEVEGPWSIFYGQDITNGWQRLSNNAKAVVVLMSPTLFQDNRLCRYLSEMWHSHQDTIMPLFLEPLTPHNLPSSLAFLRQTNGRKVSENDWNPHSFITSLLQQCSRLRCFCMEISSLEALVSELQDNPDYVCPCGTC